MNSVASNRSAVFLLIGDVIAYIFSLILTLAIRYGQVPSRALFISHISSFSILFAVFTLVSFSAGLYDKQTSLIRNRIQGVLFRVQVINLLIGIAFFYFAPVAIAPKANLFIYFVVSTILLFIWRNTMFPVLSASKKLQSAILIGEGPDSEELLREVNSNPHYGIVFTHISPQGSVEATVAAIAGAVEETESTMIVADLHDRTVQSTMPFLHSLIFSGVHIIDTSKLYESIFDRIPLTMLGERWLVENSSNALGNSRVYGVLKRVMDVMIALIAGIISLVFYPFVFFAIKMGDRGSMFIHQERVGKNGKIIRIVKFRSMTGNDSGTYGSEGKTKHTVTPVGSILRVSRLDELPQLWNVFKGDLSLIGPRPELPSLVAIYEKEIPYYNTRHLVKPGLSGWAQIYHENHPHHGVDTLESRNKLSYDLFYVKNRSFALDLKIAFRTLQILMKRSGR